MADRSTEAIARKAPDLERRRIIFRIAVVTAGAAAAMYMAPVVARIDEAEAKGSKRKKGSRRWKGPSRRRRGTARRRRFPSRRRW
jgi:hypothetical protein